MWRFFYEFFYMFTVGRRDMVIWVRESLDKDEEKRR